IVLARPLRQLDHRRRTIEYLPTPVQHEMVVRRHKRKRNRQRRQVAALKEHRVFEPLQSALDLSLAVSHPLSQHATERPEEALNRHVTRYLERILAVRPD